MSTLWSDKFKTNLSFVLHYATTWVVIAASGVLSYWLALPPETQAAVLTSVPGLKGLAPLAGLIAFIIAKGWPQDGLKAKVEAAAAAPVAATPAGVDVPL